MTHVDPKAPGDSPLHPANIGQQVETPDDAQAALDRLEDLRARHVTPTEEAADVYPDQEELERREELALATHRGDEPNHLVDLTSTAYRYEVYEDAGWVPVTDDPPADTGDAADANPEPAPAEDPDDLDAALRALDAAKGSGG